MGSGGVVTLRPSYSASSAMTRSGLAMIPIAFERRTSSGFQGLVGVELGQVDDDPVAVDHFLPRFHTCNAIRPH